MWRRLDSVSPQKWGREAWTYLAAAAATWPDDADVSDEAHARRRALVETVRALPGALPCGMCRRGMADDMRGIEFSTKMSYQQFNDALLELQNRVRRRQGKAALTPDEVQSWFTSDDSVLTQACADCHEPAAAAPVRSAQPMRSASASSGESDVVIGLSVALAVTGTLAIAFGAVAFHHKRK